MNVAVNGDAQFLGRFLPAHLAARLTREGVPDPDNVLEIRSVALLADISNFTTVAERLIARLGPEGADRLSQTLSDCFTIMIDAIEGAGGEVLSISGDAVLAAWYCDDETRGGAETGIATIHAVVACCDAMHQSFAALAPIEGAMLSLHIGLAEGLLLAAAVGGVEHRFEIVCGGSVVAGVSKAVNHAVSGSTVANPAFWRAARNVLPGSALGGGYVSLGRNQVVSPSALQMNVQTLPSEQQLRYFISDVVANLEYPHLSQWISQLRLVTALFCRLIDLTIQTRDEFGRLHRAVSAIQEAIGSHGGTLERVHLDEKGVIAVVFFGFPNTQASTHASWAIKAALAMDGRLREIGERSAIGVATGKSFSGLVGSPRRAHYTCHGNVPNLAARLMAHIEEGIVCDIDTERTTRDQYEFKALEAVTLRGLATSVPAFLLLGSRSREQGANTSIASPLIGRTNEMRIIVDAFAEARRAMSRLIIIEGEAGIGKSRLAREVIERAREQGFGTLVAQADRGLSAQPYRIWQQIFAKIVCAPMHARNVPDEQAWRAVLADDELLLPLLNPITRLEAPDNEATGKLAAAARGAKIVAMLIEVLRKVATQAPALIVLEDTHWIDTASWMLALEAVRSVSGIVVVATTRSSETASDRQAIVSEIPVSRVPLGHLSRADTANLICSSQGITFVSERIVEWIHERSQGSPFFTEELARSLRERRLIEVNDHHPVPEGESSFDALPLPYNVESALTSRIDHLALQEQIVLKCASVIGARFGLVELAEILAGQVSADSLTEIIDSLVSAKLLTRSDQAGELSCSFRHQIICRVAYGLLAEGQRKTMHGALAGWYSEATEHPATDWTLIAFHWERAGHPAEAVGCLEQASVRALGAGAFREAALSLERALKLVPASPHGAQIQEARWRQRLGFCYIALGRLSDGAVQARTALHIIGQTLPERKLAWAVFLIRQVIRYLRYRNPAPGATKEANRAPQVEIATGAVNVFAEASYFSGNVVALAASNLLAVNLARSDGNLGSAARASATIGYMLGLVRLHRLARGFFERPRALCVAADDLVGHHATLGGQAMYELGFGWWQQADRTVAKAIELCRKSTNPQDTEIALTMAGLAAHYRGRFEESYQLFAELYESASSRANKQHMAWGTYAMAQNLLPMGRATAALTLLDRAGKMLEGVEDRHSRLIWQGLVALTHLCLRDYKRAREIGLEAAREAQRVPPNNFGSLVGYSSPAIVLIALWMRALQFIPDDAPQLGRLVNDAISRLAKYAQIFPVGQPRLLLIRGWACWYRGEPVRARRHWLACIDRAAMLDMPYERGLAHWGIQRVVEDAAEQTRHRQASIALLAELKAVPLPFEIGEARDLRSWSTETS